MNSESRYLLCRIRILIGIVIAGLVVSGLTAFPLVYEVDLLHTWLRTQSAPTAVSVWIEKVRQGLHVVDANYPFLAYGTDWLAFGHLAIALFFLGPLIDPVRNVWVVRGGQIACVLVVPVALICGEIRGIPLWWRAIDCAFGIFGFLPLWLADRLIRRLGEANVVAARVGAIK